MTNISWTGSHPSFEIIAELRQERDALRAEIDGMLENQSTLEWEVAELREVAQALRAELNAARGQLAATAWHPVSEPPAGDNGVDVIVSIPAYFVPTEWGGGWTMEYPDDESPGGSYSLLIDSLVKEWRPAPPQE